MMNTAIQSDTLGLCIFFSLPKSSSKIGSARPESEFWNLVCFLHTREGCSNAFQPYVWYAKSAILRRVATMLKRNCGRVGVFVLSIYADHRSKQDSGELDRMILWPQGEVSVLETLAVLAHLSDVQQQIICELLHGAQQSQQRGPLDQERLAAVQSERGKGTVFDATA